MPSAPKQAPRREADFYATPSWVTKSLLKSYTLVLPAKIVECCAGDGAISNEIIKEYGLLPDYIDLIQYELRPEEERNLSEFGEVNIGDFLEVNVIDKDVNYVITNPPFSLAQEFIEHCLYLYPNAELIFLLPLSFLGSNKRHNFWKSVPLNGIKILSHRPSFTNDGKTDSSVYGWYFFRSKLDKPIDFLGK